MKADNSNYWKTREQAVPFIEGETLLMMTLRKDKGSLLPKELGRLYEAAFMSLLWEPLVDKDIVKALAPSIGGIRRLIGPHLASPGTMAHRIDDTLWQEEAREMVLAVALHVALFPERKEDRKPYMHKFQELVRTTGARIDIPENHENEELVRLFYGEGTTED